MRVVPTGPPTGTFMHKHILAIDLGTSGPKVGLFDSRGRTGGCAQEEVALTLASDGTAEQSPADWWSAIIRATHRALALSQVDPDRIGAVAVTAQWSGTVPVDAGGMPLSDCLTWMDTRGAPYVKKITAGFPAIEGYGLLPLIEWIRLTGGVPAHGGKDSLAHILYLKHERPDLHARTHKYLEPKDYINLVLTGNMKASYDSIALHWVCDMRNASKIDYHPALLRRTGLEREKLPDLCSSLDVVGHLLPHRARDLGIPQGIPVVCGSADLHSAAVGSGAVQDYQGHLYIGTSSWIVSHVPFKKTDVIHNLASLASAIPGRYLVANEQETTGQCLRYLLNTVFFPDDEFGTRKPDNVYELANAMAARVPVGANGLLFTPWLFGERTPVENATIRGGFHNLSLQHTRADMIRAVLEGVALNLRWLLDTVEGFQKRPFPHLNLIGGGARSDIWSQIMADVLNRPMRRVVDPVEANARGAAFIAAVALGWTSFDRIAEEIEIDRIFQPDPAHHALYSERFKEFLGIYRRDSKMCARLNKQTPHSQAL